MSIRIEDTVIYLEGRCLVEDAEELLLALAEEPLRLVDIAGLQQMHLAVAQVLLALQPALRGRPSNADLATHVLPLLTHDGC